MYYANVIIYLKVEKQKPVFFFKSIRDYQRTTIKEQTKNSKTKRKIGGAYTIKQSQLFIELRLSLLAFSWPLTLKWQQLREARMKKSKKMKDFLKKIWEENLTNFELWTEMKR